jgi:hypothetical protein
MIFRPAFVMRSNALSLLEVVVAGAVFSLLLTAVVLIEMQAQRLRHIQDKDSDAYRAAVLLLEYLQEEADGAYVLPGDDGDTQLTYRPPLRSGVGLTLGPSGAAQQEDEAVLSLLPDGRVVRIRGSEVRPVVALGARGRLRFEFPASNLLNVDVHSEPHNGRVYEAHLQLLLCNQN